MESKTMQTEFGALRQTHNFTLRTSNYNFDLSNVQFIKNRNVATDDNDDGDQK